MSEEQRTGQDDQSEDLELLDEQAEQVAGGRKAGESSLEYQTPPPPPPPPTTK
jgi:hypothetical protein